MSQTHRRLIRLILDEIGYTAAVRLLEEEAGDRPGPKRRVLSHADRAERAATELVRERARRIADGG